MVKIFSMTERLTKRENGKTAGLVWSFPVGG